MKTKYCSIEAVWPKNLAGICISYNCMQESELSEVTLTHHQVQDTIPTSLPCMIKGQGSEVGIVSRISHYFFGM